nr:hypothetical protein [Hoylesella enoeca]
MCCEFTAIVVVMAFKDLLYGKSSVLLSDAPGGFCAPAVSFMDV